MHKDTRTLTAITAFAVVSLYGTAVNIQSFIVWNNPFNLFYAITCATLAAILTFFLTLVMVAAYSKWRFTRRLKYDLQHFNDVYNY